CTSCAPHAPATTCSAWLPEEPASFQPSNAARGMAGVRPAPFSGAVLGSGCSVIPSAYARGRAGVVHGPSTRACWGLVLAARIRNIGTRARPPAPPIRETAMSDRRAWQGEADRLGNADPAHPTSW